MGVECTYLRSILLTLVVHWSHLLALVVAGGRGDAIPPTLLVVVVVGNWSLLGCF